MPVLGSRWNGYNIAGFYFLNGSTPELDAAAARRDNERLPHGMAMPGRAGTGFKGDLTAGDTRRFFGGEQAGDLGGAGESVAGALGNGSGRLTGNRGAWG